MSGHKHVVAMILKRQKATVPPVSHLEREPRTYRFRISKMVLMEYEPLYQKQMCP